MNRALLVLAAGTFLLTPACRREPERRFDLKGKVVSVDQLHKEAMIAHEEIKGYMEAMTMPFRVKDEWALQALAPGQAVEATLVVAGERSWIEGVRLSSQEASTGAIVAAVDPKPGEEIPDFPLLNQDGKRIHLGQYKGRPLLLTFIYTRCPIPDFCPRTSAKFADVYRRLQSLPASVPKPHLLTVSFDPEFDTPAVLRSYGARYMHPVDFQAWEFATGSPEEIKNVTGYFGLSHWKESGQIVHTLSTALIGPEGRLVRLYKGKEWTPEQVLAEIKNE